MTEETLRDPPPKPDYVIDLERWRDDGTFDRLTAARDSRSPIRIKRSSGEFVTGVIAAWGHGGLSHMVAWGDGADQYESNVGHVRFPPGVHSKHVKTEDLLAWNPSLRGDAEADR